MENKEKITFLIDRSNRLYSKYQKKPIYINALLIKNVNQEIINFLISEGHNFNNDKSINLILDHFLIWYSQFIKHEEQNFNLGDVFVFESIEQSIPYPKSAIESILK